MKQSLSIFRLRRHRRPVLSRWMWAAAFAAGACTALADGTNAASSPLMAPSLPDAGLSLFRVAGSLALVLALFLGGVWLFRNWQRLAIQRGQAPKLNVVETRSLGGRQALYVVGYEQERFLVASSAAGITLLTHLPAAELADETTPANVTSPGQTFAATLAQMLKRSK